MEKALIFDAGPLINFSMNGLLPLLVDLRLKFSGDFLITKEVKYEIIDHPREIKRFELEAIKLDNLFNKGVIKYANISKSQVNELRRQRIRLMDIANSTFFAKGKPIHLIDKGEAAVLALSILLNKEPVLVIDERTTRMLCENPKNLQKFLQKRLRTEIKSKSENYKYFRGFKIIRSTELIYMAHKLNLIKLNDPSAYEAMLYGMKYKGCSISLEEINELKRL